MDQKLGNDVFVSPGLVGECTDHLRHNLVALETLFLSLPLRVSFYCGKQTFHFSSSSLPFVFFTLPLCHYHYIHIVLLKIQPFLPSWHIYISLGNQLQWQFFSLVT